MSRPTIPLVVSSFEELVQTPFRGETNALCWRRPLVGDFAEVAAMLADGEGITGLDEEELLALELSAEGRLAVAMMVEDARRLRALGLEPELNHINGCYLDATPGPVRTDVCSWHVDSANAPVDTWLCTYHGATTEVLLTTEAQRRVEVPETRAALLRLFGGEEGAAFEAFLSEHCYDLHYAARAGARPVALGVGELWRLATLCPGATVAPCIHRAPESPPGEPRLLLIA